ncbi:MAG: hypothetical protein CL916_03015 [Deltaproteobacteria bacterium]|nr:hypothetical protein [Deltaproteobacteria bacterium]
MIFFEDIDPDTSMYHTSRIRALYPEVQIPIVLWGSQLWLPYQKKSLSALRNAYRLAPSLTAQRMQDQIELLLDMAYFDREEGEYHPHALGLLILTFREEKNGFLFNPYRNIPLRDGGVITIDAEENLQRFLLEENPQFEERKDTGLGDWLMVMNMLWSILKQRTSPGFLSKRKNLRLSVHSQYNRLFSLPLSSNTLKILFETDPKETLNTQLQQHNLPQSAVEQELEILHTMGFCSFVLPTKEEASLPLLQQKNIQNEEEGWKKMLLLQPSQNFILDKASPHFWRTLLDQQQNLQHSSKNHICTLLMANCYVKAFHKLKSIPSPSWEDLQLICWVNININPTSHQMYDRLEWLHSQHPTISSSILLCTIASEQENFHRAQKLYQTAQKISGTLNQLDPLKQKIKAQRPISRSLAHYLIVQNQKRKTNVH